MKEPNEIERVLETMENLKTASLGLASAMRPFFDDLGACILSFYESFMVMVRRELLYNKLRDDGYSAEFSFWVSGNLPETILGSVYFRGQTERRKRNRYKVTGRTAREGEFCSLCGRIFDPAVTGDYPCDDCGMPLKVNKPAEMAELYQEKES